MLDELDLTDVTLVGFSMGGGEVARYVAKYGEQRLRSVVFAAAIPPYLLKTDDNPDGPLSRELAERDGERPRRTTATRSSTSSRRCSSPPATSSRSPRPSARRPSRSAGSPTSARRSAAWTRSGTTDFREDLPKITVPTLVIHGDSDGIVPLEGSGARTHAAVRGQRARRRPRTRRTASTSSHADEFNAALLAFLAK